MQAARQYAAAVYKSTDDYLGSLEPADLDRRLDLSGMGSGDKSVAWVLSSWISSHASNMTGEFSVLKGYTGRQGLSRVACSLDENRSQDWEIREVAKPAILTVDDEPQVLNAVERDLRQHYRGKYRIVKAGSGAQALEAVQGLKKRNDPLALFLADQRMPSMTGTEFLAEAMLLYPEARKVCSPRTLTPRPQSTASTPSASITI